MEYQKSGEDLFISGGASIYRQCLPIADQLLISRIPGKHTGETYFPSFDEYGYQLVEKNHLKHLNYKFISEDKHEKDCINCY